MFIPWQPTAENQHVSKNRAKLLAFNIANETLPQYLSELFASKWQNNMGLFCL